MLFELHKIALHPPQDVKTEKIAQLNGILQSQML